MARMRGVVAADEGSGSILAIAIIGSVVALALMMLPLYMVITVKQSVAGAADASALAAADTAVGLFAGFPCSAAARVASANGASIASCTVDGLVVTVTTSRSLLGLEVMATATAGPAPVTAD